MKLNGKFGQVLKERRQALALSQRALAAKLGVKASHVAYLEMGRRKPSLALLKRLADTLGLDRQRLFVLARPEARALIGPSIRPASPRRPDQAWRQLVSDRALLARYEVTRRELRALKGLSLLGYVLSPREFLAILTLIRRRPDEG